MNQIISFFLPAFFAVYIFQKINNKEMSNQECIIKYFTFVLIINILSYFVSIYIFGKPYFIFTNVFTLKYLLLSLIEGVIISFLVSFIEKNIEINIRVDKNEK